MVKQIVSIDKPLVFFDDVSPSPHSPLSPLVLFDQPFITPISSVVQYPSTYVPSINLRYSKPLFSFYEDLDKDPRIHKRLTKYYYYKILDKWLYDDLSDLLKFLDVKDNNVVIIKNDKKDSDTDIEKKIDFLEKFLTKSFIYMLISRYIAETGTRWVDLHKNEYFLKQVFKEKIKKKLEKELK